VKIGYFCLQSLWSIHKTHDLELIQSDLEAGHDVHVVRPSAALRFSDTAPWDASRRRLRNELRCFWTGMNLLDGSVRIHSIDSLLRNHAWAAEWHVAGIPEARSREELDSFRFHGHDAGNAVLSSLMWVLRDTRVEPSAHRDYVERALDTSVKVYIAARAFIETHRPDRVVLFNGRMATFRGVLRACQESSTPCWVHERGATLDRVCVAENTMPHDTAWIGGQIVEAWNGPAHSDAEKRAIGREFYRRKRNKDGFNWIAYTERQQPGILPFAPDEDRPIYSIFTSSEFERFALRQYYRYLLHATQLEGILDVARILERHRFPGLLVIRIHPNSLGEHPSLQEALERQATQDFVRIAGPDSPVDTYALIDASDKVFTFGSTVAMEVAHAGKPSISFATSPYQELNAVYRPADREEAVRLILDPIEPKRNDDTLKYGYYYSVFGRPLRHAEPTGLSRLRFKNEHRNKRSGARLRWSGARVRARIGGLLGAAPGAARRSTTS